jgi:hypothetical protein
MCGGSRPLHFYNRGHLGHACIFSVKPSALDRLMVVRRDHHAAGATAVHPDVFPLARLRHNRPHVLHRLRATWADELPVHWRGPKEMLIYRIERMVRQDDQSGRKLRPLLFVLLRHVSVRELTSAAFVEAKLRGSLRAWHCAGEKHLSSALSANNFRVGLHTYQVTAWPRVPIALTERPARSLVLRSRKRRTGSN